MTDYGVSCHMAEDSFQETEWVVFKSKKYQAILNNHDTSEYGPDEAIKTICSTLALSGIDPILIINSEWRNGATREVKDKTKREVRWSKYNK